MAFRKKPVTKLQREVRALKAQLPLAKPQRLKLEQKTAQQLMPVADAWFSKYVRLRDSVYNGQEWVGECIDGCGRTLTVLDSDGKWKSSANNGHYISRGLYSLRFDEFNTNLQSAWCNAWRDKQDMISAYERGLALKHGEATVKDLKRLSKLPEAYKRPTKPELLEIIRVSKEYIDYTLAHVDNYAQD